MGTISFRFKNTPEDQAFATKLIGALSGNMPDTMPKQTPVKYGKFSPGDKVKGLREHKHKTGIVIESYPGSTKLKWDGGKRVSLVSNMNLESFE